MSSNCHRIMISKDALPELLNCLNNDSIKKVIWSATKNALIAEIIYESYEEITGPSEIHIPIYE